jgi:hypothetical protein
MLGKVGSEQRSEYRDQAEAEARQDESRVEHLRGLGTRHLQ